MLCVQYSLFYLGKSENCLFEPSDYILILIKSTYYYHGIRNEFVVKITVFLQFREQIQGTELNSSGVFGEKTMNDLIVTSENLLEERNDARKECEKMRSELDETYIFRKILTGYCLFRKCFLSCSAGKILSCN